MLLQQQAGVDKGQASFFLLDSLNEKLYIPHTILFDYNRISCIKENDFKVLVTIIILTHFCPWILY